MPEFWPTYPTNCNHCGDNEIFYYCCRGCNNTLSTTTFSCVINSFFHWDISQLSHVTACKEPSRKLWDDPGTYRISHFSCISVIDFEPRGWGACYSSIITASQNIMIKIDQNAENWSVIHFWNQLQHIIMSGPSSLICERNFRDHWHFHRGIFSCYRRLRLHFLTLAWFGWCHDIIF